MSGKRFLDTNVLLYTLDSAAPKKKAAAQEIVARALRDGGAVISFQVVGEFLAACGKSPQPPTGEDLRAFIRTVLQPLCKIYWSFELTETALAIREQTGYSYWDSMIVAAAAQAGCDTLCSEDLQHGRCVAGLKIVNPFL